jgi:hypothetical protein
MQSRSSPARAKREAPIIAALLGALVVTLMFTCVADPLTFTWIVEPDDAPLESMQADSDAVAAGVQVSETGPENPLLGVTETVVDPDCPGLAIAMPAAARLTGPGTFTVSGTALLTGR